MKIMKKVLASLLTFAIIFSTFAFDGVFAASKPTFSLTRVSETDTEIVISINLESGSFNNAAFQIVTDSTISGCTQIVKGDVLAKYTVDLDSIASANNPENKTVEIASATIASATALSNKGSYFVYTFAKKSSSRILATAFTLYELDLEGNVNIVNNIPVKFSSASLTCTISGSTATITKCKTDAYGAASIPSTYNGKTIVAIADGAFDGCYDLESITIPSGITKIGKNAFRNCTAVKSLTFGKSVKEIGENAFNGCTALETATFTGTFADWCSINFGSESANPNTIAKKLTINGKAISGAVTIDSTITKINSNALVNFTGITSVTLNDAVQSIGENAFKGCTSLNTIIIPTSVKSIASNAFSGCTNLKSVGYKSGATEWKNITIGTGNDALTKATMTYYYGHSHVYKAVKTVAATCTKDGYTEYKCTMCDDGYTSDTTKATGHHSTTWEYDSTKHWQICEADGVKFNSASHTFDANGGCSCGYIKALNGDLNYDNKINSADALLLLQFVVGQVTPNETQKTLADVNKDGKYDSSDALRILQYTVGIVKSL